MGCQGHRSCLSHRNYYFIFLIYHHQLQRDSESGNQFLLKFSLRIRKLYSHRISYSLLCHYIAMWVFKNACLHVIAVQCSSNKLSQIEFVIFLRFYSNWQTNQYLFWDCSWITCMLVRNCQYFYCINATLCLLVIASSTSFNVHSGQVVRVCDCIYALNWVWYQSITFMYITQKFQVNCRLVDYLMYLTGQFQVHWTNATLSVYLTIDSFWLQKSDTLESSSFVQMSIWNSFYLRLSIAPFVVVCTIRTMSHLSIVYWVRCVTILLLNRQFQFNQFN